jgi:predicted NAD/FAD-binding protein
MASALWSSPSDEILKFPAKYLVTFMANHRMMQANDRPQWRVVKGGSREYVRALRAKWNVRERVGDSVTRVTRTPTHVDIESGAGTEHYDRVVLAGHSDQSLALLADASNAERDVLGAMT